MRDKETSQDAAENGYPIHNSISHSSYTGSHEIEETKKVNADNNDKKYTSVQWITLVTLAFGNFCVGACISLQAPFFPKEAEAKGASPTEYGLIFGAYQLTIFTLAPVIGKMIAFVPPKFLLNSGIFTTGVTCILFGTLDLAPSGRTFVTLAFVVRIAEGIGAAAFKTSCYTIIASQFKNKMGKSFAILQSFLGIGLIMGTTLGGALYDLGGYGLPFFVMGSLVLVDAALIFFVLPNPERAENEEKANFLKFWLNPGIIIYSFTIFTTFNYVGYNTATLEPHLREFHLSGVLLGLMFALYGTVYASTTFIWGWLSDKKVGNKLLIFIACCFMIISQMFIGPMPFFEIETSLPIIIVALIFMGLGHGGKIVCTFGGSLEDSITRGYPGDLTTYGLISSMFASSQSLGAFVGPSLGGFLLEKIGFRRATVVLICLEIMLVIMFTVYASTKKCRQSSVKDEEAKPVLSNNSRQLSYS